MTALLLQKNGKPVIVTSFADDLSRLYQDAGFVPILAQPIETALNVKVVDETKPQPVVKPPKPQAL